MKKLILFITVILLYSCDDSQEIIVEDVNQPIIKYVEKTYSHEFKKNEIVYLKPDSIPCYVRFRNDSSYDLISLSEKSLFQKKTYVDTTLIFPKRLK
jgi:hypothetical protein